MPSRPPSAVHWSPDRAIFLDRDGVINRRLPGHVRSCADFDFLPGGLAALRRLHQRRERVVVVTNQSAVGRGLITREELDVIHERMCEDVRRGGGHIERVYVCPHAPSERCDCRKPRHGLLLQAARELHIDLADSIMVGDSVSDVLAAQAAGCQPILVDGSCATAGDGVLVVRDLCEAVSLLASRRLSSRGRC